MIPEKFIKDVFMSLTILALGLSAKNPLRPTDEELEACENYAGDLLADILADWVEKNGGRKIQIIPEEDLKNAKEPSEEELEELLKLLFTPSNTEDNDEDEGEEY